MNENELLKMIENANERAFEGRQRRLKFLLENERDEKVAFSGLAYEYYEEARLCWYNGAFVATIIMSQLALEETFRSYFRVVGGVQGNLFLGRKVDSSGFSELKKEALLNGIISESESQLLNKLRVNFRNPYVHSKDINVQNNNTKSNFEIQHLKIVAPELIEKSSEEEAKESIFILNDLLPKISNRLFG
jgi:hypothetical protein